MDMLFEQQLALGQGQRARALLESEPRDGCAAVMPECEVPLIQQVDAAAWLGLGAGVGVGVHPDPSPNPNPLTRSTCCSLAPSAAERR